MKTLRTKVVGIEMCGGYGSILGVILQGIKREEIQEMLDNYRAVIVRKLPGFPRRPRRKMIRCDETV